MSGGAWPPWLEPEPDKRQDAAEQFAKTLEELEAARQVSAETSSDDDDEDDLWSDDEDEGP